MDFKVITRIALAALLAALQEARKSLTGILAYAADLAISFVTQLLGNTAALEEVAAMMLSLQTKHGLSWKVA